jgi:hypothetical protein
LLLEEIREIKKMVSEPSHEVTIAIFALEPASVCPQRDRERRKRERGEERE